MTTNFKDIDFADNTLSPPVKRETGTGWDLDWNCRNLVSGFQIALVMPGKLQPGPPAVRSISLPRLALFLLPHHADYFHNPEYRVAPDELVLPGGSLLFVPFAAGVSGGPDSDSRGVRGGVGDIGVPGGSVLKSRLVAGCDLLLWRPAERSSCIWRCSPTKSSSRG